MDNTYNSGSYYYIPRTQAEAETGFWLASAASGAIMSTLPLYSKPFINQMKKEHANNGKYKDIFLKAIEKSGLKEKGLKLEHLDLSANDLIKNNSNQIDNLSIRQGFNACYVPSLKTVRLNVEKASISGFHELGHAMNNLSGKFSKILQKCRYPGYVIAGLMGTVALFARPNPKEGKKGIKDFFTDNCGKIAFAAMLPTVAEEALASYKGIKLAKQSGLSNVLIKNLKKFYRKALLSYGGHAVATGLSVYIASKIMEFFTRPKKVYKAQANQIN